MKIHPETDTIQIGGIQFIVAPEPAQMLQPESPVAPVETPKPKPRYYCPECQSRPGSVSTGTCTPSRVQYTTGEVKRRCKKHKYCRDCGKMLPPEDRYICTPCESLANLVW